MGRDALALQSVKELKAIAAGQSLSLADCFEKGDIVEKISKFYASGGGGDASSEGVEAPPAAAKTPTAQSRSTWRSCERCRLASSRR